MKMSTILWGKFESVGYPQFTKVIRGTNSEIARAFILWLADIKMGSKLRVVMTRSEAELESGRGETISEDLLSEFESALAVEGTD